VSKSLDICLVRLKDDGYSAPKGSLGYIQNVPEPDFNFVAWAGAESPFGSSGPIPDSALEILGYVSVALPSDDAEAEVRGVTNLVPFTLFVTSLLTQDEITEDRAMELAAQCRGTHHFRPSDRQKHAVARSAVGTMLGVET